MNNILKVEICQVVFLTVCPEVWSGSQNCRANSQALDSRNETPSLSSVRLKGQ
jgi:hypothetical protein